MRVMRDRVTSMSDNEQVLVVKIVWRPLLTLQQVFQL